MYNIAISRLQFYMTGRILPHCYLPKEIPCNMGAGDCQSLPLLSRQVVVCLQSSAEPFVAAACTGTPNWLCATSLAAPGCEVCLKIGEACGLLAATAQLCHQLFQVLLTESWLAADLGECCLADNSMLNKLCKW